jgi:hypothetical protein
MYINMHLFKSICTIYGNGVKLISGFIAEYDQKRGNLVWVLIMDC